MWRLRHEMQRMCAHPQPAASDRRSDRDRGWRRSGELELAERAAEYQTELADLVRLTLRAREYHAEWAVLVVAGARSCPRCERTIGRLHRTFRAGNAGDDDDQQSPEQ